MADVAGIANDLDSVTIESTADDQSHLGDALDGGLCADGEVRDDPDAAPTRSRQIPSHSNADPNTSDDTDAIPKVFRKSKKKPEVVKEPDFIPNPHEYHMSHRKRGRAIIINNKNFDASGLESRDGTDIDAQSLQQSFSKLGFDVGRHDDLTVREIHDLMQRVAKENHSNRDCVAVAILSHGGDDDQVYGSDGPMTVENMTAHFKGDACPTLAGKPKLFFVQACRGFKMDDGITLGYDEVDAGCSQRLPEEADFLMYYSTVNGYYSWRNPSTGSCFIQALCRVLDSHGETMDLVKMLTRVNGEVAKKFESNTSTSEKLAHMNRKKQMPSLVSMLTKHLYFTPQKPLAVTAYGVVST